MTRKELKKLKTAAEQKQGNEFLKAMFEFHDTAAEWWDSEAYTDTALTEERIQKQWEYHCIARDYYYKLMKEDQA